MSLKGLGKRHGRAWPRNLLTLPRQKSWPQRAASDFDYLSWISNVFFLPTLLFSPFGWQIIPAHTTFSRPNKITIVTISSQSRKTRFEDFKISFQLLLKTENVFAWSFWSQKIDVQFKTFQIDASKRTNGWKKYRKNDIFGGVQPHVFIILTKSRCCVRSGIRTHAYKSRLRPERSALDRSAILTCTWLTAESLVRKESYLAKLWTFLSAESLVPLSRRTLNWKKRLRF